MAAEFAAEETERSQRLRGLPPTSADAIHAERPRRHSSGADLDNSFAVFSSPLTAPEATRSWVSTPAIGHGG
jgi:hypothetical protein